MKQAFVVRLALLVVALVLIGVVLHVWWGLILLPSFLFFLWLKARRESRA